MARSVLITAHLCLLHIEPGLDPLTGPFLATSSLPDGSGLDTGGDAEQPQLHLLFFWSVHHSGIAIWDPREPLGPLPWGAVVGSKVGSQQPEWTCFPGR